MSIEYSTTLRTVDSKGITQEAQVRVEDNQIVIASSTGRLIITPTATNQIRINIEY